ncbi:MAG TPA: crosslink repair DNA glycosylase YcaQ family protein, partial [Candidatus Limnocylindria bacterium]
MPAAPKGAAPRRATPKPDIEIAADHARRFLVRRHLLAPPRALAAEAASVLTVVERLGLLQFDPLEVPGARNHDLVLHNRIRDYRRGWAEQWLYGEDRRLIEVYNKSLNILPIEQLPHYAITWDHAQGNYNEGILREQSAVADAIVSTIEREGPLSTAAFKEHGHAIDWW